MAQWVGRQTRRRRRRKRKICGQQDFLGGTLAIFLVLHTLYTPRRQLIPLAIKKLLHFYLSPSSCLETVTNGGNKTQQAASLGVPSLGRRNKSIKYFQSIDSKFFHGTAFSLMVEMLMNTFPKSAFLLPLLLLLEEAFKSLRHFHKICHFCSPSPVPLFIVLHQLPPPE